MPPAAMAPVYQSLDDPLAGIAEGRDAKEVSKKSKYDARKLSK
jgi:hypothetical protein